MDHFPNFFLFSQFRENSFQKHETFLKPIFIQENCWLSIIFWFWHLFWHLGILTNLAFLASLTFWHYEIQKKTALKSNDAKIKAALVFNGVFFDLKIPRCQKCQRCQNGHNGYPRVPESQRTCTKVPSRESTNEYLDTSVPNTREAQ